MNDTFRTPVEINEAEYKVNYHTPVMLIGSCFTENIGNKLIESCFQANCNPFGILYNPLSIKKCLEHLIHNKLLTNDNLNFHNELWFSFLHHSDFSNPNQSVCLNTINSKITLSSEFLKNTKFLILTFGSAWVYYLKENNRIVGNCHKIRADRFSRKLLSVDEIVKEYCSLINDLKNLNPEIRLILTVSPVRHLKDGAEGNQISKSVLLLAIHEIRKLYQQIDYFPAYEIVMDELRDYRYYDADMVHPNKTAVDYIWTKFITRYIDHETKQIMNEVLKIKNAQNHKLFFPELDASKKFVISIENAIKKIKSNYPFIQI